MSGKKIYIIGCGPGTKDYLTFKAMDLVSRAEVVIGPEKFTALFEPISGRIIQSGKKISLILEIIEKYFKEKDIALLVSGDPGCFSLSRLVIDRFGLKNCLVVPGISSVQLASAKLGLDWTNATVLSVHGRETTQAARELFITDLCVILLGDDLTWMAPVMEHIPENSKIYLMQNLGLQVEKISTINSALDLEQKISSSSLLVVVQESR